MQQLFIPNPSQATLEALDDIGYQSISFTDAGCDGVLTIHPVEDIDYVASALKQLAGVNLVPDTTPPEFDGFIRARAISDEELGRYQYMQAAASIMSLPHFEGANSGIVTSGPPIQQLREQLSTQTRAAALLLREQTDGFDPTRELKSQIESEFQTILSHPQVTGIDVGIIDFFGSGRLIEGFRVHTRELTCKNPNTGYVHSIGEFEISFGFNPSFDAIMWINKTRVVVDHQAPHVRLRGDACLGNMDGIYRNLLARGEYFTAVDMGIKFIESVNITDSYGRKLIHWPVIS